MLKQGIIITYIFLLIVFITSCGDKTPVAVNRVSGNPEAQTTFNDLIKLLDSSTGTNDSLIYYNFNKAKSLLEGDSHLLLYRKMGEYFYNKEIPDSALVYFLQGLEIAKKTKNIYYTSVFHMMCGSVYTITSDFEPALVELKAAHNISTTLDSFRLQIRTSRNLGNVYWNMGNYDRALDYYLISLDISRKTGNELGIASALNNIGNVYQEVKNYNRAIDYYKQSEAIAEANGFERIIAISNNNLGDVFSIKRDYDSALYYFTKALEQVKQDYSRFDAGIYIGNLADLYLKTDSLDKSKHYFLESLSYASETGDKTGIASCNLGLAEVHLKEKNFEKAKEYLNKGTEISEEIGSFKLMAYAYQLNSMFYLQKNDFPNSHLFLTRQMAVKDSIYSLENGENVARLENQYQKVQNIKQIELLKEKQKSFLYLSILGFSAFVTISLLIFIAYRQKTKTNLLLNEKNMQIEASRVILEDKNQQLIKSQEQLNRVNKSKDDFLTIISHDLKNPLSSIRGFTELLLRSYDTFTDDQRKAFLHEVFDSIENISLLINNILYWVKSQTDGIQFKPVEFNLLKRINENISIYRLMLNNKGIQLENKIPDNINVLADCNVFDMILRNILSNALKFTPAQGKIAINCKQTEQKIRISVSDTGIGIPEDKLRVILSRKEQYSTTGTSHEQGTGLGLGLIYQFVEQTGGNFKIESAPGKGTTISFTLNVVS